MQLHTLLLCCAAAADRRVIWNATNEGLAAACSAQTAAGHTCEVLNGAVLLPGGHLMHGHAVVAGARHLGVLDLPVTSSGPVGVDAAGLAQSANTIAGRSRPTPLSAPMPTFARPGVGAVVYILGAPVNCTLVGPECAVVGGGSGGSLSGATAMAVSARAVAPGVQVVSVPMLLPDGTGTLAGVLRSLGQVASLHAESGAKQAVLLVGATTAPHPKLDRTAHALIATALAALQAAGVIAVAAGGETCNVSPAAAPPVLVVGGASMHGGPVRGWPCSDVYGPGSAAPPVYAAMAAGIAAGIVGDATVGAPAWLVADMLVTNATRLVLSKEEGAQPTLVLHAPRMGESNPIIDPESDWLPCGLGLALLVAAAVI